MSENEEIRRQCLENQVCAISHPGGRERNEDDFLATRWNHGWFLAVADGLGGHRAGEIASRCAISSLASSIPKWEGDPSEDLLRQLFRDAHNAIRSRSEGAWIGMGTTLVAVSINGLIAIVAHTGDSRAYVVRDRVNFRTRDHSVVQDLIDSGVLTNEEGRRHPMKNMLTAALGIDFEVDVETVPLAHGDFLLLSSDGFYDFIEENRMVRIMRDMPFVESAEVLLQEALRETNDNVTFVIYRVP